MRTKLIALFLVFCLPSLAFAATVRSVRGTKVLLDLDKGESFGVSETLTVVSSKGKPLAVLVVKQTNENQAIADIASGRLRVGSKVRAMTKAEKAKVPDKVSRVRAPKAISRSLTLGGSLQNQKVRLTSAAQVGMTGFSPFLKGTLSSKLASQLSWEVGLGLDQLKTTGSIETSACGGNSGCVFELYSLVPSGRLIWNVPVVRLLDPQVRAGVDFLVPVVVNSNVIEQSRFSPLMLWSAGGQISLSRSRFVSIPIGSEVSLYFGNTDVTLIRFLFYAGYTWQ